ncbi:MAG: type II CAAX prenyl endopeptidase Rce1 family protein [Bacillota bacterium]
MEGKKEIGILGVNTVFFITALLLIFVGSYVQYLDIKIGLLITEFILVLLPPIIYIKFKGADLTEILRIKRLKAKHGVFIVFITILSYPVALFFNLIGLLLLSTLGQLEPPPLPTADNLTEYLILFLIFAGSAGICEEIFFRGLIMRGYERFGKEKAIVVSALLFGMFHFNLQNLLGPIFLGLIFGYLVYRTDSIAAGIIGHTTNNGVAVTLGWIGNLINEKNGVIMNEAMPSTLELVGALIGTAVIATITGFLAFLLLRIIVKETQHVNKKTIEDAAVDLDGFIEENTEFENDSKEKTSLWAFIPVGLTIMIFLFVSYLQITKMYLNL